MDQGQIIVPAKIGKGKAGRPPSEFDLRAVEEFGRAGCSFEEMAAHLDVDIATISRHMNKPGSEFARSYKKGFAHLRTAARSWLVKRAKAGDTACLIFLNKVINGMSDRVAVEHSGVNASRIEVVYVDEAQKKDEGAK